MGRQAATVLYVFALIAVVVGVDVLFFRHQFWERLMVNVGIVLVFAAFGLRFLKRARAERFRSTQPTTAALCSSATLVACSICDLAAIAGRGRFAP